MAFMTHHQSGLGSWRVSGLSDHFSMARIINKVDAIVLTETNRYSLFSECFLVIVCPVSIGSCRIIYP